MDPQTVKITIIQFLNLVPVIFSGPVVLLILALVFQKPLSELIVGLAQFFFSYRTNSGQMYPQGHPQQQHFAGGPHPYQQRPPQEPSPHMHQNLAQAFAMKGSYDEAISQYKQAIQLDPENASVYIGLGNAFHKKGLYAEAIKSLEKAVQIKPYWADCRCNLGAAYSLAGMHDKAIEEFVQAININPNYAAAHYGLGIAYTSAGKFDKAGEQVETLKELNSQFAEKLEQNIKDASGRSRSSEEKESQQEKEA
jgi:tetratricopeptide (TPR) repeat protein